MRIHLVIFIAQLKFATLEQDFYHKHFIVDLLFVINAHAKSNAFFYKIKRLIDKRVTRDKLYYLVK